MLRLKAGLRASPMALELARARTSKSTAARLWRGLIAAIVVATVGGSGLVWAANQSVQGFKKEEGGFDEIGRASCRERVCMLV